ncbi:MAG: hypothetical protein DWQ01_15860 [Planctomycetota bacterium]|nr:MAG: hypothetical protein DWQ01_15860 [Planctomycetota bacterium]
MSGEPLRPSLPRLRRFLLLEEIGRGKTGTLYRARVKVAVGGLHPGQEVAVKILHPELVELESPRKAFLREARAGMKVRHPNLVKVYAVEEVQQHHDRRLYLVLELLRGRTLREWLQQDGLAQEPTLRALARQVASALEALHDQSLLHLDVKPENILWDQDRAVLLDLGFVRRAGPRQGKPADASSNRPQDMGASSTWQSSSDALFIGTPAYAAPELLYGEAPQAAADLFALGVTLYECATGVRPFGDEGRLGLFEARRSAVVRKPSTIQPRLSPFFDTVILALLEEDPQRRLHSAAELTEILSQAEQGDWWRRHGRPEPLLPLLHPEALPFADRQLPLQQLQQAFQRCADHRSPQLVALEGPAAVGKSRLVLEFARRLRQRSEAPPFLYGRCLRIGRGSAFRAVRDALARSLGLTPEQKPTEAVVHRLRKGLSSDSASVLIGVLEGRPYSRTRRRQAFLDWFRALGKEGPFLVFLDDLHVIGAALWEFAESVLEQEDLPVLMVFAYRPPLPLKAKQSQNALARQRKLEKIQLFPLDQEASESLLIRCFAPRALPSGLKADLLQLAEGLPGKLHDLLRSLRHRQEIHGRIGSLVAKHQDLQVPLTADMAELLKEEILAMPAAERTLLQWASMLAPPLYLRLLARLAGFSEARSSRVLSRLRDRGWLQVSHGRYRFQLPRLRVAAYRSMSDSKRRDRHRKVFQELEQNPEWAAEPGSLVFHAHRGDLHEASLKLGLPRLERFIVEAAEDRMELAMETLWPHIQAIGWSRLAAAVRVRWRIAEAWLWGRQGNHAREADLLKEAGLLAQEAGDQTLMAKVHLGLSRHARAMGFAGAARVHLERARNLRESPAGEAADS